MERRDETEVTVDELRKKGLVDDCRGEGCEGGKLFMATGTGADDYRARLEAGGSYTHIAAHLASSHDQSSHDQLRRGLRHSVDVRLANPADCLARMQPAVLALAGGKTAFDIKTCGPVRVFRDGVPVSAWHLTLREVLDQVGCDAVRFMMLYRKHDAPLNIDLVKVLEQSKDNPVFYVQYAHARAKSVFRSAQEIFPDLREGAALVVDSDLSLLVDPGEIALIRTLALFPALVEGAARAREPHRLAVYLYDLASSFHDHYTRGNDLPHLRFIQPADGTVTAARLALVQAIAQVLAVGAELLGVLAPLEMR